MGPRAIDEIKPVWKVTVICRDVTCSHACVISAGGSRANASLRSHCVEPSWLTFCTSLSVLQEQGASLLFGMQILVNKIAAALVEAEKEPGEQGPASARVAVSASSLWSGTQLLII